MSPIISATLAAELANSRIAATLARTAAEVFAEQCDQEGNIAEYGHSFELAVSEAFTNSVKHCEPNNGGITVSITIDGDDEALTVSIADSNPPFNHHRVAPEITTYPDSGFGLFIIDKLMDTVDYERANGRNVLTMSARFPKQ